MGEVTLRNSKKLSWVCVKAQRLWMNQETALNQECESRLRQAESADVPASVGVRKW